MEYAVLGGLVVAVWALLLWLSIIVWVYRDIRDRTRDVGLQVLAVFVVMMFFPGFNIPGLALYLMLRPRDTLEDAYARSLEEEALLREIGDEGLCPSCRRFAEKNWRTCPFCQTQLKDVCSQCNQLLSFNWVACPYCGTQRRSTATPSYTRTSTSPSSGTTERAPAGAANAAAVTEDGADGAQPTRRTAASRRSPESVPPAG
jgi:RNA polymerase subunit RPABC4/transcription elongation factor Spt4